MKNKSNRIDERLIETLADGQFHSGQALADALGVSRTAINKHIDNLDALQLDVFRVHGKGYRLAQPLQLLKFDLIREQLREHQAPIYLKRVTSSTHDDLKQLLVDAPGKTLTPGTCVLAEMQTRGRGRRGRTWLSPFGSNLYASFYWPLPEGLNSALGLSVAVGLRLAQILEQAGIQGVSVKWPNDVYIQGAKVAGVLVELEGEPTGEGHALIGIGLNLSMPERFTQNIEQPYTDVQKHLDAPLNRHQWAVTSIRGVTDVLEQFRRHGLADLVTEWRRLDHFYNQPVNILLGQHVQQGVGQGIDNYGALLVRQGSGLKRYFGGEISIRARQ